MGLPIGTNIVASPYFRLWTLALPRACLALMCVKTAFAGAIYRAQGRLRP